MSKYYEKLSWKTCNLSHAPWCTLPLPSSCSCFFFCFSVMCGTCSNAFCWFSGDCILLVLSSCHFYYFTFVRCSFHFSKSTLFTAHGFLASGRLLEALWPSAISLIAFLRLLPLQLSRVWICPLCVMLLSFCRLMYTLPFFSYNHVFNAFKT